MSLPQVNHIAHATREIPLTKGLVALVDTEDFDLLSPYSWRADGSDDRRRGLYAVADIDGRTVRMHRLIAGAQPGQRVDHRNHDGLDNRRRNLRLCTNQQNARNRRPNTVSQSGMKGVSVSRGRYQVSICIDGKAQYLGLFADRYLAALAYDDAAAAHFGDFARLNFDRCRDWIIGGRSVGTPAKISQRAGR